MLLKIIGEQTHKNTVTLVDTPKGGPGGPWSQSWGICSG